MDYFYSTPIQGYLFLAVYAFLMLLITVFFARLKPLKGISGFLLAGRKVGWFFGSTSIAASWIWAPALFVSVQLAYEYGLAGIFWFTFPNIVALALFSFLAPRIRARLPEGFTLPQYIKYRLHSESVHKVYLVPYFFYQLMAVTVQLFAGGSLLSLLTGIPLTIVMPILAAIALSYTLVSGLAASIVTDFVQFLMIVVIGAVVLPWTWHVAGGFSAISAGFNGVSGTANIFDPGIAFSLGIVTSIGLIAGVLSDQQYWQRAFAIQKKYLRKTFIFGALMFGVVPVALSTLGFLAANPALGVVLPEGVDVAMIGVQTVATMLPPAAVLLFVVMLLAGLSSTLDSGLSATSALWVTDVAHPKDEKDAMRQARYSMVGVTILGLAVAYAVTFIPQFGLFHLWWIFNTIAATVVVPTVLSLFWDRLDARGVFWGVLVAFVFGLPVFVYGNLINDPVWTVGSSLFIIGISTGFCLLFKRATPWKSA